MMNISDIRVETHISFAKHRYIVTFVGEGFFIASDLGMELSVGLSWRISLALQ